MAGGHEVRGVWKNIIDSPRGLLVLVKEVYRVEGTSQRFGIVRVCSSDAAFPKEENAWKSTVDPSVSLPRFTKAR